MNISIIKLNRHCGLVVALGALLLPGVSVAQQYYDPGLLHKTIERKPVDFQSLGVRMGGFKLFTGAELAYEENSNIFYGEISETSDSIIHVRPWASLSSDWNRHQLNFSAYADLGNYDKFGSEDYEDWVASLDGRVDIKHGSNVKYKASYKQLHEDRSSPDDVRGIKPTEFVVSGFDVGYNHTFNRVTAGLNYNRTDTDYDDNLNGDGDILDNQDRDRTRDTVTLRFDFDRDGQRGIFVSGSVNNLDYDQTFDNAGFERSSNGYNLRGGLSWDKTGVLVGDLYVEYIKQEYDDWRFANIDGFGIGASLDWTPTQLTDVNLLVRNGPQETTQGSTSGYLSSLYSFRVQHELRRNWLLNARASYTNNDYETLGLGFGSLTETQVTRLGAGVSYLFNRHLYISGGYVRENQDANTPSFEYNTNRWFITLGADL